MDFYFFSVTKTSFIIPYAGKILEFTGFLEGLKYSEIIVVRRAKQAYDASGDDRTGFGPL